MDIKNIAAANAENNGRSGGEKAKNKAALDKKFLGCPEGYVHEYEKK